MQAQIIKAKNGFVVTFQGDNPEALSILMVAPNLDKLPELLRPLFGSRTVQQEPVYQDVEPEYEDEPEAPVVNRGNSAVRPLRQKARQVSIED